MFGYPPERVAWITLVGALLLLLAIVASTALVSRWFLLESATTLTSHVRVGRGTVGVRLTGNTSEEVVRNKREIARREYITTDEIAQGYIEFIDQRRADRVVAHVVLPSGSQVQLIAATRPRFSFSEAGYEIVLREFEGRLEVEVPPNLPDDIFFSITGAHGEVQIRGSGLFLVWSLADSMTLIPRDNSAWIRPFFGEAIEIPAGQTAALDATNRTFSVSTTTDELIQNALFLVTTEPGVPDDWGCYGSAERADVPRGTSVLQTVEGRRAVFVERRGQELGASETGCQQFLGQRQAGLDVTGYRTLRLRATMNIRWHSLAVCGALGSECALMMELTYLNEYGQTQRWIHGFYAYEHVNADLPRSCNSCLIEHDRVTAGNWYTYESANLFRLPEGFRPTRLQKMRFYVSGHEYDVLVSEIALLGER